jgi:hypothetical protein
VIDSQPAEPALDGRYRMQINFPDAESSRREAWETVGSFETPIEALRGCSECTEVVKMLKDTEYSQQLPGKLIRLRVWDEESRRMIFWEGERGDLQWDDDGFASSGISA